MMLTSTVPYLDSNFSTQSGPRWPVARCSFHWQRGRLIPTVQCVLVHSEHFSGRVGALAGPAARSPGPKWASHSSKLWLRTKALAVNLAETHKALTSQSLQTLQRVGSIIRSTSIDCLAALGSKQKGTAAVPGGQPPQQPPEGDSGDDDEDSLVRASLSRFLTTASDAEVSQAARMSLLSDMAYDVSVVTSERLQEQHGLALIAHSRSSATAQHQPQLQDGNNELQQQHLPLPQGPWPVPMVLLQPAASTGPHSPDYADLPASPRAPAIMGSYAEDELYSAGALPAAEFHAVTASGLYADPGSPRRPSAAAAAAASAVMGMPAAPAMGGVPPSYQQQPMLVRQHSSDYYPPYGVQYPQHADEQLTMDEAALLQQLKQQEAFILLEMQASQQMMLLLQQQSQQQASAFGYDMGSSSAVGLSASAQDLQQLQEITAAASTAAAAALAGSSMWDDDLDSTPGSPLSTSASAAVAAAAAEGMTSMSAADGVVAGAPSDWFCCDGPLSETDATPTRFFAIQGSITLDHWRINLTIDPCEFEAGALGPIRVHRGMYEAALSMYDTVLPLVQQHLAAHPQGKIALTGHSLGGSLATMLMLLMVHRGDLPVANVATVYTFGAPAVFCEGANGSPPTPGACQSCSLPCEHRKAHIAASSEGTSATDSLLSKLCLPADAVVNVIMTRDIVPRAFVCDYTLVAGVLQRWLPSFKEHKGLAACKSHKALYNFIGVVEVLQPTKDCDFVLPDEGHDMLPPGAALYKLTEPQRPAAAVADSTDSGRQSRRGSFNSLSSLTNISSGSLSSALAELTSSFSLGGSSGGAHAGDDSSSGGVPLGMVAVPVSDAPLAPAAMAAAAAAPEGHSDVSPFADVQELEAPAAAVVGRPSRSSSSGGGAARKSSEGLTLGDAILTFMNSPHPLQTLGEMRAYGHNGSISRYHNPASYAKALQKLSKV